MMELGNGNAITWESGFMAEIQAINWDGFNRDFVESSHAGTATARTFVPKVLYDPGTLEVELHFDPATAPPVQAAESCTVTWADGSTWAASAFLTGVRVQGPWDDKQVITATLKFSGAITVTPA